MTDKERFYNTIADLESGKVRVAEKVDGEWKVNSWVKEVILSGFRLGKLTDMTQGQFSFFDKDTIPARTFNALRSAAEEAPKRSEVLPVTTCPFGSSKATAG